MKSPRIMAVRRGSVEGHQVPIPSAPTVDQDPHPQDTSTRRQLLKGAAGAAIGCTALAAQAAVNATPASAESVLGAYVGVGSTQTITGNKTFSAATVLAAPTAQTVPAIIKGAAGQTADLAQWQSAAGAVLARISANGSGSFPRVHVEPVPKDDGSFFLKGRHWGPGQQIAVPYFVPTGNSPDQVIAFDLLVKGHPPNYDNLGVAWIDICDANEAQVDAGVYQATRIGKTRDGYGYVAMAQGDGDIGNNAVGIPLVLQHLGGSVGIGTKDQFGGGIGVIGIKNATTLPTKTPSGGGVLYVDGGALKWRGSSGTVTTIAPA